MEKTGSIQKERAYGGIFQDRHKLPVPQFLSPRYSPMRFSRCSIIASFVILPDKYRSSSSYIILFSSPGKDFATQTRSRIQKENFKYACLMTKYAI